jgi:hypothetical protein
MTAFWDTALCIFKWTIKISAQETSVGWLATILFVVCLTKLSHYLRLYSVELKDDRKMMNWIWKEAVVT